MLQGALTPHFFSRRSCPFASFYNEIKRANCLLILLRGLIAVKQVGAIVANCTFQTNAGINFFPQVAAALSLL